MKFTAWFTKYRLAIVASVASATATAVLSGVGMTVASTESSLSGVDASAMTSTPT